MNFSAPNSSSHTDADWCESEQDARRALEAARGPRDSALLNEALIKLRDAWTARANAALAHAEEHGIQCTEVPNNDEFVPDPGVYLVTAPQVGADARRLLTAGSEHGVPVLAFAREPLTKLGERPIAVLGRGVVIRTRVPVEDNIDNTATEENTDLYSFYTSTPKSEFDHCEECLDKTECVDCFVKHVVT